MGDEQQAKSAHELLMEQIALEQETIKLETLKQEQSKAASEAKQAELQAQAESEKPKVPADELLKKEQALVAQAAAEAQKATAKAEQPDIPTGTAKPKEGGITLDGQAGYFASLAAYQAARCLAREIANEILPRLADADSVKILLTDAMDFSGKDVLLLQLTQQLAAWQERLDAQNKKVAALLPKEKKVEPDETAKWELQENETAVAGMKSLAGLEAALPVLPLLGGVLSATADIIGYFQTDYSIIGKSVAVDDLAVRASLAGDLRAGSIQAYFPSFHRVAKSQILDDFATAAATRGELQENLDLLNSLVIEPLNVQETTLGAESAALQAQLKLAEKSGNEAQIKRIKEDLAKKQAALQKVIAKKVKPELVYARAVGAVNLFDQFNQQITTVAPGSSYAPLAQAAIRGWLDEIGITHLLYAKVTSSGGEVVTSKNFWRPPKMGFLAGSVVTYVLADNDGQVIAANTLTRSEYIKFVLGQDDPPTFGACSDLAGAA